jgi:hypothetical protein
MSRAPGYVLLLTALLGCHETTETLAPENRGVNVAIVSTLGGQLLFLSLGADTALIAGPKVLRVPSPLVVDSARAIATLTSYETFSDRSINIIDIATSREVSRIRFDSLEKSSASVSDVSLGFGDDAAIRRDGSVIAFASATRFGDPGLAIASVKDGRILAFEPNIRVTAATFGPWRGKPSLIVSARRALASGVTRVPQLFVFDVTGSSLQDSVPLQAFLSATETPTQLVSIPSLGRILLRTQDGVLSCTLEEVVPKCSRMSVPSLAGGLWYRDGDEFAVINDAGTRDSPGSGAIFQINLTCDSMTPFVLPLTGGAPSATLSVQTDRDRGLWYIAAGSSQVGPLYPTQPSRILVFDPVRRKILRMLNSSAQIRALYRVP